ncbi:MAG: hypothetical protein LBC69_00465 [Eubacteriaceae bacterium]|jgi:predicted NUDIX family phosphoesterase|nr:hypothetical protein [Eubacteriaceae bacterium]
MEKVLVVSSEKIGPYLTASGLITEGKEEIVRFILSEHCYLDRAIAENAEEARQIIPYAVLRSENRLFALRRLSGQTEARLHGMLSLGVGGHVNPDAESAENPLEYGLLKEVGEEVSVAGMGKIEFHGIIHDASDPVSLYHLGLLYTIEAKGAFTLETEKMAGEWMDMGEARRRKAEMEAWSRIALEYIETLL